MVQADQLKSLLSNLKKVIFQIVFLLLLFLTWSYEYFISKISTSIFSLVVKTIYTLFTLCHFVSSNIPLVTTCPLALQQTNRKTVTLSSSHTLTCLHPWLGITSSFPFYWNHPLVHAVKVSLQLRWSKLNSLFTSLCLQILTASTELFSKHCSYSSHRFFQLFMLW